MNGGILPRSGVASERVCACSLHSRLVFSTKGKQKQRPQELEEIPRSGLAVPSSKCEWETMWNVFREDFDTYTLPFALTLMKLHKSNIMLMWLIKNIEKYLVSINNYTFWINYNYTFWILSIPKFWAFFLSISSLLSVVAVSYWPAPKLIFQDVCKACGQFILWYHASSAPVFGSLLSCAWKEMSWTASTPLYP